MLNKAKSNVGLRNISVLSYQEVQCSNWDRRVRNHQMGEKFNKLKYIYKDYEQQQTGNNNGTT